MVFSCPSLSINQSLRGGYILQHVLKVNILSLILSHKLSSALFINKCERLPDDFISDIFDIS